MATYQEIANILKCPVKTVTEAVEKFKNESPKEYARYTSKYPEGSDEISMNFAKLMKDKMKEAKTASKAVAKDTDIKTEPKKSKETKPKEKKQIMPKKNKKEPEPVQSAFEESMNAPIDEAQKADDNAAAGMAVEVPSPAPQKPEKKTAAKTEQTRAAEPDAKKKRKGKNTPPKGYFNSIKAENDVVSTRKFLIGSGLLKADEMALMSDADVMGFFEKEYVILSCGADSLVIKKQTLESMRDDIVLVKG